MRFRRTMKRLAGGQAAVIGASLLLVAVGCCMFDGHHDGSDVHGVPIDLCGAFLASSFAATLLAAFLVIGSSMSDLAESFSTVSLLLPDPPPKF